MINIATISDIPKILPLVQSFIKESAWGWHYSEPNSVTILSNYVESEETEVLYNQHCFATIAYDNEFHEERLGFISKFYVAIERRGTDLGRMLLQACNNWFDKHNCHESFATATANVGENKLFQNLMAKSGYKPCGETLVRKRSYEQN